MSAGLRASLPPLPGYKVSLKNTLAWAYSAPRSLRRCVRPLQIIGVDSNEHALKQAATRASAAGLKNLFLFCGDASSLCAEPPAVDLVVGLHACGGLSDVALQLAASAGASALVCSCCYWKCCKDGSRLFGLGMGETMDLAGRWGVGNSDQELLCRLADCERPEFARPAKQLLGCMRLRAHRRQLNKFGMAGATVAARNAAEATSLSLLCFDQSFSPQNIVLSAQVSASQRLTLDESQRLGTVEATVNDRNKQPHTTDSLVASLESKMKRVL